MLLATTCFFMGEQIQESLWIGSTILIGSLSYFLWVARNLSKHTDFSMSDIPIYKALIIFHPAALIALIYMIVLIFLSDQK